MWIPAIEGFVPAEVIRCFTAFLDFCYIARSSVFTRKTLDRLDGALTRFHNSRKIFQELGVRDTPNGFSLPRQHAMAHYRRHIQNFGAPNGLCSSITESRHISAVKRPWRRSNRYNPIHQIMETNRRAEMLAAARAHFTSCGMLGLPICRPRTLPPAPSDHEEDNFGEAEEGAIYNEVFLAQTHGICTAMFSRSPTDCLHDQLQGIPTVSMALGARSATRTSLIWFVYTSSDWRGMVMPIYRPHDHTASTSLTLHVSGSFIRRMPSSVHHLTPQTPPECLMRLSEPPPAGNVARCMAHGMIASSSPMEQIPILE